MLLLHYILKFVLYKNISPKTFRNSKYITLISKGYKIEQANGFMGLSKTSRLYQRYKNRPADFFDDLQVKPVINREQESLSPENYLRLVKIVENLGVGNQFITAEFLADIHRFLKHLFKKNKKLKIPSSG